MDSIHKLIQLFSEFPGIGPRQSKRFVYFLLTRNPHYLEELSTLIKDIRKNIRSCTSCFRFYTADKSAESICKICRDTNRDTSLLMLVSRDIDLETIERSKSYAGHYFVLGGNIPVLDKAPEMRIRQKELLNLLEKRKAEGLKEIILALNATTEGENTTEYLQRLLSPLKEQNITTSVLGRGLSTGTELEYSDGDTIKNALKNRA